MLHLAADVENYGSLDACSAFPFENYMQQLKRLVCSGKNPLAQIVKRLSEASALHCICPSAKVGIKKPNNAFILSESSCSEVVDQAGHNDVEGNELCLPDL